MRILEEFYYGNIDPSVRSIHPNDEFAKLLALANKNSDKLIATLSEEQKEIFERFTECSSEMNCIGEREAFIRGYSLGARMMVEVMMDDSYTKEIV